MISVLLVDAEATARAQLRQYLDAHPQDYTIVAEATNMITAIRAIIYHQPKLVFLAIELPGQMGLHLSNLVQELYPDTRLVVMAKGQQYAIEALRKSIMAYLLKPLKKTDVYSVLERLEREQQKPNGKILAATVSLPERLLLPNSAGMELLASEDILYLEAHGAYTHFHLQDGSKQLICKPLGHFDYLLEYDAFFRSHRSYIVHLQAVKKYLHAQGGQLLLNNDQTIPLSRTQKKTFLNRIQQL